MDEHLVKKSRFLSRVLRHRPDAIGITLDGKGWTDVGSLLEKAAAYGMQISREELDRIVVENDKRRFIYDVSKSRIRAVQGHSVQVDLKLPVRTPPPMLFHGTIEKFLPSIRKQGLLPGSRHDVHLSATMETALAVGARRGSPVVISVETYPLLRDGFHFRCADNGVWLISKVPVKYLRFPDV